MSTRAEKRPKARASSCTIVTNGRLAVPLSISDTFDSEERFSIGQKYLYKYKYPH